jgi:hypothetical protein
MTRPLRGVLLVLLVAGVLVPGPGCSEKQESQPNPEFKAPDIPPGRGQTGEGPMAPPKK